MRAKKVKLRNPELPDRVIWVFEASAPAYFAAGWEIDDTPEPPKQKAPAPGENTADQPPADAAVTAPPADAAKPAKPARKSTPPGPPSAPQGADRGPDPASTEE